MIIANNEELNTRTLLNRELIEKISWSKCFPQFIEPSVHYHVDNSSPIFPNLSQINSILTLIKIIK
jgi:hypothetical protein